MSLNRSSIHAEEHAPTRSVLAFSGILLMPFLLGLSCRIMSTYQVFLANLAKLLACLSSIKTCLLHGPSGMLLSSRFKKRSVRTPAMLMSPQSTSLRRSFVCSSSQIVGFNSLMASRELAMVHPGCAAAAEPRSAISDCFQTKSASWCQTLVLSARPTLFPVDLLEINYWP